MLLLNCVLSFSSGFGGNAFNWAASDSRLFSIMDILCITPLEQWVQRQDTTGQRNGLGAVEHGRQEPTSKEAGQIVGGVQTSVTDAARLQWIITSIRVGSG